ncbi:hypothetical protein D3C72_1258000 [compost metagenome]
MLAPLVADQAHGRHDIEHTAADRVRNTLRLAALAEFGIAVFVLRPKPVHDETVTPVAAALLTVTRAFGTGAEGRRPGQGKHVEIETRSARCRIIARISPWCLLLRASRGLR